MPSTLELRRRIRSIRSTRQITKAMELVAAAKMRRASEATLGSRAYAEQLHQVLADLSRRKDELLTHPLLEKRPLKRALAVVISSDRGLAGSYNTALLKQALQFYQQYSALGPSVSFITMGKKVEAGLNRLKLPILQSFAQVSIQPQAEQIYPLTASLAQLFTSGEADQISLIYTNYFSTLKQEVTTLELLPLSKPATEPAPPSSINPFLYEPDAPTTLAYLLPRLLDTLTYQALLEAVASEHAARRVAMKNATDNAGELIGDLTLTYNSLRQNAITQEIAEITSGAAALA